MRYRMHPWHGTHSDARRAFKHLFLTKKWFQEEKSVSRGICTSGKPISVRGTVIVKRSTKHPSYDAIQSNDCGLRRTLKGV